MAAMVFPAGRSGDDIGRPMSQVRLRMRPETERPGHGRSMSERLFGIPVNSGAAAAFVGQVW